MKKQELKVNLVLSSEPYDPENLDLKPLVDLCNLILQMDREYHSKQLKEGKQFCEYCGTEIKELSDFYSYKDKNICAACCEKVSKEPDFQETFCGFKVSK